MSEGGNADQQALEITIGEKFIRGTEKTKSLYSFARIYRVPKDLCKLNETAYIPRLVAIGPLHRNDEHLPKSMQDVKMDYANRLFLRLRGEEKDQVLQECVETMKKCTFKTKKYDAEETVTLVDKAKKYYAEDLKVNDEDMLEMMLVDGCFLLELLYVSYHTDYCKASGSISQPNGGEGLSKSNGTGCEQPRADPIFDSILTANIVKHDLILLENQVPFFVLEHLFKLTIAKIPMDQTTQCPPTLSLEVYIGSYFHEFLLSVSGNGCVLPVCRSAKDTEPGKTELRKADDYYHILHFIHSNYIPDEEVQNNELKPIKLNSTLHSELTLSATDLLYAGVEFVPSTTPYDVKFVNEGISCCCRTLEFRIPTISIGNTTESFLRNVIALEQCSPGVPRYFTSYAKLMDMFINSEEDVRVLVQKDVINNYLSTDKDVCDLFNKLCKEVVLEDFHFDKECQKASDYNMHWRTRAERYVTRLFLASPWPALAFCLGIVTFVIAIYQFGYSIHKQLHHH